MVGIPGFCCHDLGSIPGLGTEIKKKKSRSQHPPKMTDEFMFSCFSKYHCELTGLDIHNPFSSTAVIILTDAQNVPSLASGNLFTLSS